LYVNVLDTKMKRKRQSVYYAKSQL